MTQQYFDENYDLLITEREPIIYFEHAKIEMDDGKLTAYKKDYPKEVIPANSSLLLFLGAGTSISQPAAIHCAQKNMYVVFARGGCYVHSIWQSSHWQDPEKIVRQVLLHNSDADKLSKAKKFLELKLKNSLENKEDIDTIQGIDTITKLLSHEAVIAKKTYNRLKTSYKVANFTRDKESENGINGRITLLNNAMYTFCTAIIIAYGFHPSIGFVHGKTRRGGLSFDLADIFKHELTLIPSFRDTNISDKELVMNFASSLKYNNFRKIKEMLHVLKWLNGEISDEKVNDILNEYSHI
jgi:CRISPR-associated protein Cas1